MRKLSILTSLFLILGAAASVAIRDVEAAPLNFSNNTNLSVASPATTLVVAAGSVADQLVVNATSVVVTISTSTGGTFTLTAAASNFTVATSSGGGTADVTCTAGVASTTITQLTGSDNYTITPTGTQCGVVNPTSTPQVIDVPYASSGGGGSGGGSFSPPSVPTSTSDTGGLSSSSIRALIAQLQEQLALLLQQAAALGANAGGSGASGPFSTYHFTRDLKFGDTGLDVAALQRALVAANTGPAARAIVAHGYTMNFAKLTLGALKEFQAAHNLPATGYFGKLTRAILTGN